MKPSETNKCLIVLDDHISHKSMKAIDLARENNITLATLRPLTSHRLQPLGITFFGPLKTTYYREMNKWMLAHPGQRITDYDICEVFNPAHTKTACKGVKGFQSTGIFPHNLDIFSDVDFSPSLLTDQQLILLNNDQQPLTSIDKRGPTVSNTSSTELRRNFMLRRV